MKNCIIVSEKEWHRNLVKELQEIFKNINWILIDGRNDFSFQNLQELDPIQIFIPHWSYIIPSEIYTNFECIVFHMTDLPYGRGGSPLQNLICRGKKETKISALRVEKGLDTGPIYLKKSLSLMGTAQEIFLRAKFLVKEMIIEIIDNQLTPVVQEGEIIEFKRRKPENSNLEGIVETEKLYDHIRMLDCDGYPPAFIETEEFRFEFSRASLRSEIEILADVRIIKK
jgi:methionyl-tRNA formyltransferase